ncbi:MAG: nucleotidyltransferase family protein [Francisellaceae bacterium]
MLNFNKTALHWRVHHIRYRHEHKLWQFSDKNKILGVVVNTFQLEYLFVYLCMHGAHSRWKRLSWLVDVKDCYMKFEPVLNFAEVIRLAEQLGLMRPLCQAAVLLKQLFAIDVMQYFKASDAVYFMPGALKRHRFYIDMALDNIFNQSLERPLSLSISGIKQRLLWLRYDYFIYEKSIWGLIIKPWSASFMRLWARFTFTGYWHILYYPLAFFHQMYQKSSSVFAAFGRLVRKKAVKSHDLPIKLPHGDD